MKLKNQFAVQLIPALAALLVLSLATGSLQAAGQPKAGAAKTNPAQKRKTALVMLGSKDTWHMAPEQVDAVAGLLAGYCQLAANFSDDPADFTVENIRKYDLAKNRSRHQCHE